MEKHIELLSNMLKNKGGFLPRTTLEVKKILAEALNEIFANYLEENTINDTHYRRSIESLEFYLGDLEMYIRYRS